MVGWLDGWMNITDAGKPINGWVFKVMKITDPQLIDKMYMNVRATRIIKDHT